MFEPINKSLAILYTGWSAYSHKVVNVKFFVKNQTRNYEDKILCEQ